MPKVIINIFFLLLVLLTSLPVKHASRLFFKKQAQAEMCDDCCDDVSLKKEGDTVGFKEYPCCHYYSVAAMQPASQNVLLPCFHADWRLPLWPAVKVHTPPPNEA